jgi:ubiquinone/menaquinone biosynthesis C-methylase UbiE
MQLTERQKREIEHYKIVSKEYLKKIGGHKGLKVSQNMLKEQKAAVKRGHIYLYNFIGDLQDKKILDYGCGDGHYAVFFALKGAKEVHAFDISPDWIKIVQKRAEINGVSNIVKAEVMQAEKLRYKDNYFDIVWGIGVLHHLNIKQIGFELRRILKPGGNALFIECIEYNRILDRIKNFVAKLIRYRIRASQDESPLTIDDITWLGKIFSDYSVRYYRLFARLDRLIKNNIINNVIYAVDDAILKLLPFLKPFAGDVALKFVK